MNHLLLNIILKALLVLLVATIAVDVWFKYRFR